MERKILALALLVFVFAWAWLRADRDDLEQARVTVLVGIGVALLLGAFMMGCATADIFFLTTDPHYCPLIMPGYALIACGFAILGKRLWIRVRTGSQ